jgi:hypothetical protein
MCSLLFCPLGSASALLTFICVSALFACKSYDQYANLRTAVTYAKDEFKTLVNALASRLAGINGGLMMPAATLCYMCAHNVDALVEVWCAAAAETPMLALVDSASCCCCFCCVALCYSCSVCVCACVCACVRRRYVGVGR